MLPLSWIFPYGEQVYQEMLLTHPILYYLHSKLKIGLIITWLRKRPILFTEFKFIEKNTENACTQAKTNQKRKNAKIRTTFGKR